MSYRHQLINCNHNLKLSIGVSLWAWMAVCLFVSFFYFLLIDINLEWEQGKRQKSVHDNKLKNKTGAYLQTRGTVRTRNQILCSRAQWSATGRTFLKRQCISWWAGLARACLYLKYKREKPALVTNQSWLVDFSPCLHHGGCLTRVKWAN